MLPLHPKLVHLPVALALLMPVISVGLFWAWRARRVARRGWWLAGAFQLLLAASAVLALRTGGEEEERVERVVPESAIHAHEEAAEAFVWTAAGVAAVFLISAFVRREAIAQSAGALACLGTLVVLALAFRTGEAGGRLVYQYGAASAYTGAGGTPVAQGTPADTPAAGKDVDEDEDAD